MSRRFSPLERRALLALVSLIRDRESDPDFWSTTEIPLGVLYERLYVPGDRPWVLERRNQRQATRRALGRLHPEYVSAMALAWVSVEDEALIRWQGGGSGKHSPDDPPWRPGGYDTPRWRLVGLTTDGIKVALELEAEGGP